MVGSQLITLAIVGPPNSCSIIIIILFFQVLKFVDCATGSSMAHGEGLYCEEGLYCRNGLKGSDPVPRLLGMIPHCNLNSFVLRRGNFQRIISCPCDRTKADGALRRKLVSRGLLIHTHTQMSAVGTFFLSGVRTLGIS